MHLSGFSLMASPQVCDLPAISHHLPTCMHLTERLSREQRHASVAEGAKEKEAARGEGARSPSVLCDVHWVRLICDEGHSLGGGSLTNLKV